MFTELCEGVRGRVYTCVCVSVCECMYVCVFCMPFQQICVMISWLRDKQVFGIRDNAVKENSKTDGDNRYCKGCRSDVVVT